MLTVSVCTKLFSAASFNFLVNSPARGSELLTAANKKCKIDNEFSESYVQNYVRGNLGVDINAHLA